MRWRDVSTVLFCFTPRNIYNINATFTPNLANNTIAFIPNSHNIYEKVSNQTYYNRIIFITLVFLLYIVRVLVRHRLHRRFEVN